MNDLTRDQCLALLTESERMVVDAVIQCGDVTSAASQLCISTDTARTHLRNIRSKLGVNSTMRVVLMLMPKDE